MKKFFYGLLCFAFLGFLTACGGADDEAEQDTGTTDEQAANEEDQTIDNAATDDHVGDEDTAEGQATDETTPTVDTAAAEAKYQQSCSACHGKDLSGGVGPELNTVGAKLSKDEILAIIEKGQGSMPGGLLKGEDAEGVAAWLAGKK